MSIPGVVLLLHVLALACRIDPNADKGSEADDSGGTEDAGPDLLAGVQGSEGAWLWLEGPDLPAPPPPGTLERQDPGQSGWSPVGEGGSGTGPWWDPESQAGSEYRFVADDLTGGAYRPELASLVLASSRTDGIFFSGEELGLELAWELHGLEEGAAVALRRQAPGGAEEEWLDLGCVWDDRPASECWGPEAVPATLAEVVARGAPVLRSDAEQLSQSDLVAELWAVAPGGAESQRLHTSTLTLIELARALAWGDLHAHSNLSNDGCEEVSESCADREGFAGEDFFTQAADRGLDFAALTDHSEWTSYTPTGGETLLIWEAQQQAVANAEGSGVVPILGYEWTDFAGATPGGGHKTVLFSAGAVCTAYRLGASLKTTQEKPLGTGILVGDNREVATTPGGLFSALADAAAACPETPTRVQTFFHHPAFTTPQDVDWTDSGSVPDARFESLVEIYSEHGASECADNTAPNCDWRMKTDGEYSPTGGIQKALQEGFRLGFVAGTDSHNSMPGSVEDGPSCTSNTVDDAFICHDHAGGLTGMLYEGPLDREALFDAMFARHTLATSGPRLAVRAVLIGADGQLYLPGDPVPVQKARPGRLLVSVEGLVDPEAFSGATVEVLDADNEVLASAEDVVLDAEIPLFEGEALYIRVRLHNDGDGERLWLSPFFLE